MSGAEKRRGLMQEGGTLGGRLASARKRRGLSQRELAQASGLSVSLIRKIEQGEREDTRLETARKLAAALGVPTTTLADQAPLDQPRAASGDLWSSRARRSSSRSAVPPGQRVRERAAEDLAEVPSRPGRRVLDQAEEVGSGGGRGGGCRIRRARRASPSYPISGLFDHRHEPAIRRSRVQPVRAARAIPPGRDRAGTVGAGTAITAEFDGLGSVEVYCAKERPS